MTSFSRSLFSALAAALLCLMLPASAVAVPAQLNHQGRLLDAAGVPVEGELEVTFTLENASVDGSVVWSQTLDVDFRDGYYSVRLGGDQSTAIDANLLAEEVLWIGVSIEGGEPLQPLQKVVSAPYAVLSDSAVNVRGGLVEASEVVVGGDVVIDTTGKWVGGGDFATSDHGHGDAGVPLGTIIDWWRPSPDVALPAGYQICDGGTVDDVASPWFGYPLPDLIGRVAVGVGEEEIGLVGGDSEHSHEVAAAPHDHSIDHDHGVNTGVTDEVGPLIAEAQVSAMTGSGGAVATGGADNTTGTTNSGAVTGGSNGAMSGAGGSAFTSGSTAPTTSAIAASTTGTLTTSFTSTEGGATGASDTPETTLTGTGSTANASPAVTGGGFGSTNQSSSSSTGSAGNHNHKTFRWDQGNRRWKHYTSSGAEELLLDYAWNEGTGTTLLESQFALGLPTTTGSQTSYTHVTGSHSHSNTHSHSAGAHGHSMSHNHQGPAHSHQNEHSHGVDDHNHTMVHQHALSGHDHDSEHMHAGPSHDHSIAHDHNTSGHDHELAHAHTGGAHQHDASHEHEIAEHEHDAGNLAAPPFLGASASAGTSAAVTSDLGGALPPYVGLLKLMRVR